MAHAPILQTPRVSSRREGSGMGGRGEGKASVDKERESRSEALGLFSASGGMPEGGLRGQDTALIDTHSSSSSLPRPRFAASSSTGSESREETLSGNLESN